MANDLNPILLTGATGYLGSRVSASLRARGIEFVPTGTKAVAGIACDLRNAASVRRLLASVEPSVVIHCAATVPSAGIGYEDSQAAGDSVGMMRTVASEARCPIVFASSMTVYSCGTNFPVTEDMATGSLSGYALGKRDAERLLFEREFPGDVALRLPGLFGLPRRSGLLYNAARSFMTRGSFELSNPTLMWAAMHVDDAAEYMVRAAIHTGDGAAQPINVGYDAEFSLPSAVAAIASLCGVEWTAPLVPHSAFSMSLKRLESRYGVVGSSFHERLAEFVAAIRRELNPSSTEAGDAR